LDTEKIKRSIVDLLTEKKAKEIVAIDVKNITTLTDFFIICSGTSNRHRKSLADDVVDLAQELGLSVNLPREGYEQARWILIDCKDIVVNIFDKESREKYNLEKLWSDGLLEEIREA